MLITEESAPRAAFAPPRTEETLSPPVSFQESLDRADQQIRAFARERPVTVVVGSIVVGFVIGKLAARL